MVIAVHVGVQGAHAPHQHRHLWRRQREELGLVDKQFLRREGVLFGLVVSESVGHGLEDRETVHVCVFLSRVCTTRREGHVDRHPRLGGRLFDGMVASEHNEVGEGDLGGCACSVERGLNFCEAGKHATPPMSRPPSMDLQTIPGCDVSSLQG